MAISNTEIADLFSQFADLLEIEGANPFRIRAYRNAARLIDGMSHSLTEMLQNNEDLTQLPGIGEDLAEKIETIIKTGKFPDLDALKKKIPALLTQLMSIKGLGPKRIQILYNELKLKNINDLEKALDAGKIRELPGFAEKTEELIAQGIQHLSSAEMRMRLADAEKIAEPLVAYLKQNKDVKDIVIAGSFRRRRETVGDLDILVTTQKGKDITDYFVKYDRVAEVMAKGPQRSTVILHSGLQVDLRVVPAVCYGAALLYFTGSKAHNIKIRKKAVKKQLKINEYGVFKGNKRIAGKTEKQVYKMIGLPYIEPELREDRGEIEAAMKHKLPKLITLDDIRGDLHCHTHATDGNASLEDMVEAAKRHGYEYIAITDHSKHLTVAHGFDKKRLLQQIEKIDKLNQRLKGITILKSIELDILEDGSLDLPDELLAQLDLRVCSIHYKFGLSRQKQMKRILRAMDNPYFNILAHPTGRLINSREPYEVDMEKIIQACKERGCFLELNAQPARMDLDDHYARMAKDMNVKLVISTDSHSVNNLANIRYGVDQARRAWLESSDVLNTLPLSKLKRVFNRV